MADNSDLVAAQANLDVAMAALGITPDADSRQQLPEEDGNPKRNTGNNDREKDDAAKDEGEELVTRDEAERQMKNAGMSQEQIALALAPFEVLSEQRGEDPDINAVEESKTSMQHLIEEIKGQMMSGRAEETAEILAKEGVRVSDPDNRTEDENRAIENLVKPQ